MQCTYMKKSTGVESEPAQTGAYARTLFRVLGFHPRSFSERFLGNRHRRPFSAQGLGQIRAKQP